MVDVGLAPPPDGDCANHEQQEESNERKDGHPVDALTAACQNIFVHNRLLFWELLRHLSPEQLPVKTLFRVGLSLRFDIRTQALQVGNQCHDLTLLESFHFNTITL